MEHELEAAGLGADEAYFCSLSSRTIVYKGQLKPDQVRADSLQIFPPGKAAQRQSRPCRLATNHQHMDTVREGGSAPTPFGRSIL